MATPTKKLSFKNPYVVIGGLGIIGLGAYLYIRRKNEKKEGEANYNATPYADQGLTNQSFIPVVSGPNLSGAGAIPHEESRLEMLPYIIALSEQGQHERESIREETNRREESREEHETSKKTTEENESKSNAAVLQYLKEANEQNVKGWKELVAALTGGGAPGTTTTSSGKGNVSNNGGGTASPTPLFGGRKILGNLIIAANGKHCPNTEYNRNHPHHMRGCI